MGLEKEEAKTASIVEEVEVDLTLMEVNSSNLRHLKVFLLITIRVIHLLMLLRLIVLHARFVGNLDILLWTVTTE